MDWKSIHPLESLTHIDGRSAQLVSPLRQYFSPHASFRYCLFVMAKYLEFLSTQKIVSARFIVDKSFISAFNLEEAEKIAILEKETHSTMRALERYFKEYLRISHHEDASPFVNLGITETDIMSIAIRLQIRDALYLELLPQLGRLLTASTTVCEENLHVAMLGRIQGQPVAISTLSRELCVCIARINSEIEQLMKIKFHAKCAGEIGTFSALSVIFPGKQWWKLQERFLSHFELHPVLSTQGAPYDDLIHLWDSLRNSEAILINLTRDLGMYSTLNYISHQSDAAHAHQKVPSTGWERVEAELVHSAGLFDLLGRSMSSSRLQGDLSYHTLTSSVSEVFASTSLSCIHLGTLIGGIRPNAEVMESDIGNHWEIGEEILLAFLKNSGNDGAYEAVRAHFNGNSMTYAQWQSFITSMQFEKNVTQFFLELTPNKLIGEATEMAVATIKQSQQLTQTISLLQKKYSSHKIAP